MMARSRTRRAGRARGTTRTGRVAAVAVLLVMPVALALSSLLVTPGASPAWAAAQDEGDDASRIALLYHRLSGDALDLRAVAERGDALRGVSNFDRADAVAAEVARLQAQLAGADTAREFVLRVSDRISEYDHERGTFGIELFAPGAYVPLRAFGQDYMLVFANAASARTIPMPKEEARAFDARLNAHGRSVTDEVRFRVTGRGDPAGGVTGARVVRAELVGVRVLDASDAVLFTPTPQPSGAVAAVAPAAFDAAAVDVAGLRVGMSAADMEATLERLLGPVSRGSPGERAAPGIVASLTVNSMGCMSIPGRPRAEPGAVCVTALLDGDDVVRVVRVERLFPWFDAELFRGTMVRRYGAVSDARSAGGLALGWGPEVDGTLVYDGAGPHTALTAHYTTDDDFMSRGSNALPRIRVVLQLADARWAATAR